MERCQEPTQRAQQAVQQELQHVQESLSRLIHFEYLSVFPFQVQRDMCRCVLQCQDEVKDKVSLKNLKIVCFCCPLSVTQTQLLSFKVGPNTPESEMRKFRGEFETCAIACCDK